MAAHGRREQANDDLALGLPSTVVAAMDNEYGWRLGRVTDPYGHDWEIGKPLK